MVTKAIIAEIIDRTQARVRIPIFDKAEGTSFATPNNELAIAPICSLAGSSPNYKVGDVVFVAFEYDVFSNPVIIGSLLTDSVLERTSDFNVNRLQVVAEADLPTNTNINNVNIGNISGAGGQYNFVAEEGALHIELASD